MSQSNAGISPNNRQLGVDNKKVNNHSNTSSTTITPTPSRMISQLPSPPETLTESLSNSQSTLNSSTDDDATPSRPFTPQRGRLDARYPSSLGPGRVPLHRRGTSKTYERMEDLLREAGYKETRVFTPETERAEAEAEERKERALRRAASVRNGVDAVVGFIAGLVSRAPSVAPDGRVVLEASGTKTGPRREYSPPPSPLAHKPYLNPPRSSAYTYSRPVSPSSLNPHMSSESLNLSPRASPSQPGPRSINATPRARYQDPYSQSPTRPSRLRPQPSFSSNTGHPPQTYAQASKARLYLRHMASAPSIHPASGSSLKSASVQRHSSSRYANRGNGRRTLVLNDDDGVHTGRRGNGEGEEDSSAAPPLQRTWIESVARAVLFGGANAHMSGPSAVSPPSSSHSHSRSGSPKSRLEALRMSPASSNFALSDHMNVPRHTTGAHAPPFLLARIAAQRAPSESRVSRTRVVCRSAPASRSGSRVRPPSDWGLQRVERGRERKSSGRGRQNPKSRDQKGKGKPKDKDGVPVLVSTHAQDDDWSKVVAGDDIHYTSASSSEDDEGELDLARLLVPPKRQNSIRSLRKHLHATSPRHRRLGLPHGRGSGAHSSTGSVSRMGRGQGWPRDDDWNEESSRDRGSLKLRHGRMLAGEQDDGIFFGSEGKPGARKRTGISGTWAQRNLDA